MVFPPHNSTCKLEEEQYKTGSHIILGGHHMQNIRNKAELEGRASESITKLWNRLKHHHASLLKIVNKTGSLFRGLETEAKYDN